MKSVFGLGASVVLEALLPLVRLVILARFLPQDQFGIAVTVLVTFGIIEMCCDLGLVQSAIRGSDKRPARDFIDVLHTLSLLRYAVMAVIAAAVLWVQKLALDAPLHLDVVIVVALAVALKGFENLQMKQLSRSYNFSAEALLLGGSQVVWTVVTFIAVHFEPSAVSLFYGMFASVLWILFLTNMTAPYRWRLGWNREAVREALQFGVPMIPNGFASAVVSMDRIIVSNLLGTRAVAVYGVAIGLATLPRAVLYRFSVSALVPHFANLAAEPEKERRFYRLWVIAAAALSTTYALALVALGPVVIHHVFGEKYVPSDLLMLLVAINAVIKFMMLIPVPAAFAHGQTKVVFLGSLISALANIPASLALLFGMRNLETFVLALDIFEGAGLIWFLFFAASRQGVSRSVTLATAVIPIVMVGSIAAIARAFH